jgi:hypothetical protein
VLYSEGLAADGGPDDIDDGVCCPDFMKMNGLYAQLWTWASATASRSKTARLVALTASDNVLCVMIV